jgi:hypothetical protein
VTKWVYEKIAQNVAQPIFLQNLCIPFSVEKRTSKFWATFVIFTTLPKVPKQLLNRRTFAQSGHPATSSKGRSEN